VLRAATRDRSVEFLTKTCLLNDNRGTHDDGMKPMRPPLFASLPPTYLCGPSTYLVAALVATHGVVGDDGTADPGDEHKREYRAPSADVTSVVKRSIELWPTLVEMVLRSA
jgi:hypothetical protein